MEKPSSKPKRAEKQKKGTTGKNLRAAELRSLLSLTQQAAREWRVAFDAAKDGIWTLDREYRIRRANKTSEQIFQRPIQNMLGRHYWEIIYGASAPVPDCPLLRTKVSLRRERMNLAIGEKWFEVTADPIFDENGEYDGSVHILTDITERIRAEKQIQQMKRLYATLSQVNQTIVRATSREELFDAICKIAVNFGEFSLAWIGLLNEESGVLEPVAANGMNLDKWDFPLVNVHSEEYQSGVTVTALRAARVITSEDLSPGETPTPEMRRLYEAGWHSIASVPFRQQGKVIGVLILASGKNDLFKSEDELRLLDEIGLDVSFALDNFLREAARRQAEAERQNFYETLNASLNEIYLFDAETLRFTFVSAGALQNLGYTMDELRKMTPLDLKPSLSAAAFEKLTAPLRRKEAQAVAFETSHRRANGSSYPVEVHLQLFDQPPRREFLAVILDITERKQAEEALRQSEERYRYLFENNPHPMWAYDLKTLKFLAVNDAAVEKYGYSRDEFMNLTIADIRPPEDVERLLQDVARPRPILQHSGEWRHKLKNGAIIDVEITSHTLNIAGAEAALVVAQDITERKRAEEARRESEDRFKYVFDNSTVGKSITGIDGALHANRAFCEMVGYSAEELENKPWREITHPDDIDLNLKEVDEILTGKKETARFIKRYIHKDGHVVWADLSTTLRRDKDGAPLYFMTTALDITERKQAEEAIRQSEEKMRSIFRVAPTGIGILRNRVFLEVNPRICEMTGYEERELVGQSARILYPTQEEFEMVGREKYRQIAQRGAGQVETRWKKKDGTIINIFLASTPIDLNDLSKGVIFTALDITERKEAEEALRQSERQMKALLTSLDDIVFELDENGTYLNVWAADESLLALPKAQLLGRRVLEVISGEQGALFMGAVKRSLAEGKPQNIEYPLKVIGGKRWFMARISPIFAPQGTPHTVSVLVRDITARVKNEEKLALKNRQLNALNQLGLALAQSLEIPVICRAANQWIAHLVDCPNFGVSLFNEQTRRLKALFVLSDNLPLDVSSLPELEFDETLPRDGRAKAILDREIAVTSNMRRATDAVVAGDERLPQSALYVPMILQERLIGLLELQSYQPDAYAEADLELFETVANQIGLALENARLFQAAQEEIAERRQSQEQVQIQLKRLGALHEIDRAIGASMDMRLSLDILLNETLRQLGLDAACILLLSPSSQTLEYLTGKGFRSTAIRASRIMLGQGFPGQAGLERKTIHVPAIKAEGDKCIRKKMLEEEEFVEYICVPLIAKGLLKGVLEVFNRAPLNPDMEWMNYLETLGGQAAIAIDNAELFEGMQRSNLELVSAYDATIEGWSRAMDLRDKETEGHTLRVTEWTVKLAKKMGVSQQEITHIRRGALLHDIGKLGVPDHILNKPDKLDRIEWAVMRQHPIYAFNMLMPIHYLRPALDIPYCHHEKWDGSGYPRGLKGEEIPLAARIFAVVDVWDALRSNRPYREGWEAEKVREYLLAESGKHFDPQVVEAFLEILDEE